MLKSHGAIVSLGQSLIVPKSHGPHSHGPKAPWSQSPMVAKPHGERRGVCQFVNLWFMLVTAIYFLAALVTFLAALGKNYVIDLPLISFPVFDFLTLLSS
jgi:hypothetical protein